MTRLMPLILLLVGGPALASEPTLEQLLDATDDVARGESSEVVIEMQVKTKRYERTMRMHAWSRGEDHSLIKIEAPAKDAGITTLRVEDNIWNYLPKVDRVVKVPAGMMSGSWMGSHFSNDDLVNGSRYNEDYTSKMLAKPGESYGGATTENYVVESIPKPDAPVVWGKVHIEVRPDLIPVRVAYYDEGGDLARTMTFTDIKEMDGVMTPAVMTLTPSGDDGEFTRITYVSLDYDVDIDDSFFTLQALK